MTRRVGRYTKHEITELTRMFGEGYSVYKICRSLNRSQKSIRNNLIRLGLIEGEITPRQYKPKIDNIENISLVKIIFNTFFYILLLSALVFVMLVEPMFNLLEMFILGWIVIFQFVSF
jgi:hypothetical protein